MPNYKDNCFPGVVDNDIFCFRYTDKDVTDNEQYLMSNYWREQINTYGTKITYFVNLYDVLKADNLYGEDPTRRFSEGVPLILAVDLAENANVLSKFGFQSDDELTCYIHLSSFQDAMDGLGIELITTELSTKNNEEKIDTENGFDLRTEDPKGFETQFNEIQPKAGDVFQMTEYGRGRPGDRNGKMFEVTEVLDQDISRTNQLGGHYVWIIKAKRYDYSFEPGLSAEKGSQQVYDNARNGILSGGRQDPSEDKKYQEQYPLVSIDQVSEKVVFDMPKNNNTSVYGGY